MPGTPTAPSSAESWTTTHDGRLHEVTVGRRRGRQHVVWCVDGREVARAAEHDDTVVLTPAEESDAELGAVAAKGPAWFGVTRRVVLLPAAALSEPDPDSDDLDDADEDEELDVEHEDEDDPRQRAELRLRLSLDRGTVDLDPEPGSRAERRLEWIERHPRLHVAREVLGSGGGVMVPILLVTVVIPVLERFLPEGPDIDVPKLPLPDLPDLPSIPWPDLPSIPFPDLPDWFGTALKLVIAVAVAWSLARREVKRRQERATTSGTDDARSEGAGGEESGADGSEASAEHA